MKKNLGVGLWTLGILLVLIVGATGFVSYKFWKSGIYDSERIVSKYEASIKIDRLNSNHAIKNLKDSLVANLPHKSSTFLSTISDDVAFINRVYSDINTDHPVKVSSNTLENNLNSLKTATSLSKLISVFRSKVKKFNSFVVTNRWRTLTRLSTRILGKLGALGRFNVNKFSRNFSLIKQDIEQMRKVTTNSILTKENKRLIIARLDRLNVEIGMIEDYLSRFEKTTKSFENYEVELADWLKKISPQSSLELMTANKTGQHHLISLISLTAGMFLIFICSLVAYRFLYNRNYVAEGKEVLKIFRQHILSPEYRSINYWDESFSKEARKLNEYVQKRMNFGNILNETIPFPSILLDENLKVEWVNDAFCEEWEIDHMEVGKELLSWDYLVRFTNLEDNDPVIEASSNGIGGIYQVKLNRKNEKKIPFEAYVSPVKTNRGHKVVIYFYSLASHQETIHNHAISIISPIKKMVDYMHAGSYEDLQKKDLLLEFEEAEALEVHDELERFYNQQTTIKDDLLNEITQMEGDRKDLIQLNNNLLEFKNNMASENAVQKSSFKNLRELIINYVEKFETSHELSDEFAKGLSRFLEDFEKLSIIKNKMAESLKDGRKAFPQNEDYKLKTKELIKEMTENLSNPQLLKEKLERLEKTLSARDVQMAKAKMIFDSSNKLLTDDDCSEKILESYKDFKTSLGNSSVQLESEFRSLESEMVEVFQGFSKSLASASKMTQQLEKDVAYYSDSANTI